MNKLFLMIAVAGSLLVSCDVRKKDKVATTGIVKQEVKDPTTVQLIDSLYDFGQTTEGEIVQYNYRFKNTGDKPLVITDVKASCGCTVPEKPEQPIMPGDTGVILVKFNSANKPGEIHKTITVSANANPEFPLLVLKGTVIGKEEGNKQ
ncbi:MAG: DUF1573 domain-containing protein [Bacteroidetes bacterium]|nr:DUF1573 domain-containing protein [Bacteroidota bacterium]